MFIFYVFCRDLSSLEEDASSSNITSAPNVRRSKFITILNASFLLLVDNNSDKLSFTHQIWIFYNQIIEQFQKCHLDHPVGKFFGECTDLKIKLDRCFRQEVRFLRVQISLVSILPGAKAINLLPSFAESCEAEVKLRGEQEVEGEAAGIQEGNCWGKPRKHICTSLILKFSFRLHIHWCY